MRLMRVHELAGRNFFMTRSSTGKTLPQGKGSAIQLKASHFCGKTKNSWSGPFIVRTFFSHGAVVIFDRKSNEEFKVNGQRLKPFLTAEPESQAKVILFLFAPSYT